MDNQSGLMDLYRMAVEMQRNQAPGMGSTANAQPLPNEFVDARQHYGDMGADGNMNAVLGAGALWGIGAMPPNPATLAAALGTLGYTGYQSMRGAYGNKRERELGYQGN